MTEKPAGRLSPLFALLTVSVIYLIRVFLSTVYFNSGWENVWLLIQEICLFGLPAVLIAQRQESPQKMLRLERRPPVSAFAATIAAAVIGTFFMVCVLTMWSSWLASAGLNLDLVESSIDIRDIFTALMVTAIAPAVSEELFFRGFLLTALEPIGGMAAVGICGALFALTHASLGGLPAHLMLGIVIGMIAYGTDSLALAMVYHFTHNATIAVISFIVGSEQSPSGIAAYILSPSDARTVLIETAVFFVLYALSLRVVMARGRAETDEGVQTLRKRQPAAFWICLFVLLLVMTAMYIGVASLAYLMG